METTARYYKQSALNTQYGVCLYACRSASWKQQNPDWEYLLWTDVDNKEFVGEKYPEYFHAYSALPIEILRADMVRGLYMHAYGGVYADMDTWCLRPMDSFLNDTGVYLAEMSKDLRFEHNIPVCFYLISMVKCFC